MRLPYFVKVKYNAFSGQFDEASLSLWVAEEAHSLERSGVRSVAKAIGK